LYHIDKSAISLIHFVSKFWQHFINSLFLIKEKLVDLIDNLIVADISPLFNKRNFPQYDYLLVCLLDICNLTFGITSNLSQLVLVDSVDIEQVLWEILSYHLNLFEVLRVQAELKLLDHLTMDIKEYCHILGLFFRNS
jgi:hypothetical protein